MRLVQTSRSQPVLPGPKRFLLGMLAVLTVMGTVGAAGSSTVSATSWQPDAWLYCSRTVPPGATTSISYAGIFARPHQNSAGTSCRDRVQNSWFSWYSSRPINWTSACKVTYGSRSAAYVSGGRVYCT